MVSIIKEASIVARVSESVVALGMQKHNNHPLQCNVHPV